MAPPENTIILVSYGYPLALYCTLSISMLVIRSFQKKSFQSTYSSSKRPPYAVIYALQVFLCLCLICSLGIAVSNFVISVGHDGSSAINEAQVICYLAVLLYFAVGLLPDQDVTFQPSASHSYAWASAGIFEAVIQIIQWKCLQQRHDIVPCSLGIARLVTLLSMVTIYHAPRGSVHGEFGEEERLLPDSSHPSYGSANEIHAAGQTSSASLQRSSGWLEYFVGFRLLFPHLWPSNDKKQQLTLMICLILMLGQRIVNILVPYQLEILVGNLGEGKVPYKSIALYVLYRGLQGQQGVLGSLRAILWIPVGQSLFRRLTCAAFAHIMSLSLDFHLGKRMGEIMSALNKGSALNTFLDSFAFQLFPMVFDLGVAAVYFLIRFDAFYSLILIAVMWSYIYMTMYMAKWRARARREMATKDREMDAVKADTMLSYETVHHNGALPVEARRFASHVSSYQNAEYSVLFSLNALNITQNLILTVGTLLVILLISIQISAGLRSVATFVSILAYFTQLQAPLQFFGSFYNQVQNNLLDAERMLALFKEEPTIVDADDVCEFPKDWDELKFSEVSFAYGSRKPAVDRVSFTIPSGTTTAIVGESGGGKSTCLRLLFRFYDVSQGSVNVDGHDIRRFKLAGYRNRIAVVPQDTILFNTSILENLQYAKPSASLEEIYEACRAASIHDSILSFPERYDTKVGERGLRLSGGEKQRIAIARALLKDPQIILLDEATSSLDTHTEKQIQSALEAVTKGRTTVTVTHRLSTIVTSDQILVMDQGKIIERGTHVELLAKSGHYWEMWQKQTRTADPMAVSAT